MKKGVLLNSEISYVISKLGHTDGLVVADCGLPIPDGVKRIDLAVKKGIPSFLDVLDTILEEQKIEEVIIASEMKKINPNIYKNIIERLKNIENVEGSKINIIEVKHEDFKEETKKSKAIIRTGEFTPYANIILKSGVTF